MKIFGWEILRVSPPKGRIVNAPKARPFVVLGDSRRSIFFLPGFTRFAPDGEQIARFLNQELRATFFGENLPGHESFEALGRTRSWSMLEEAEERFLARWNQVGQRMVIAGVSTGALIGVIIAARHPDKVSAVVPICAAKTLVRKTQNYLWLGLAVQWLFWPIRRSNQWAVPADTIGDKLEDESSGYPYHTHIPLWTGSSLLYLQILFEHALSKISCPVLVVSSKGDDVVSKGVAQDILKSLRANPASHPMRVSLDKAPHVPTRAEVMSPKELATLRYSLVSFLKGVWEESVTPPPPQEATAPQRHSWFADKWAKYAHRGRPEGGIATNLATVKTATAETALAANPET